MLPRLAEHLREVDPDRFAMALMAPQDARPKLLTLYALNLELARTPLAAREPMIAEIRVQWWVDRLQAFAGGPPPPHELLTPLWEAWGTQAADFAALAEVRRRDAERRPFADTAEVMDYTAATAGALMAFAAGALGADPADPLIRAQGQGAALAAWLRAASALTQLGLGLAEPGPVALSALACEGQAALARAAAGHSAVPRSAAPALYPGTGAARTLSDTAAGRPVTAPSTFARRAALARFALTGRWWGRY
ncbi:MAG TPA: squalene/phytoene synthase family protein [Paracoccus sp. (in: a-proteobacteria)]|nr:squalene/phytoene synthase family protein [Paracoccus sp. (in: a-proteobacteria)]